MTYHFRDPIHGMIEVSDKEERLISLPGFQRLRYIRQLGTTFLVYHGAEHTRFGHSLGVMHLAGKAMESLEKRGYLDGLGQEFSRLKQIARLMGLLHDVGHGPFSHVGEESGLYPELEDIDGENKSGHEVYTRLLIRDYFGSHINEIFKDDNITKDDILAFLSGFITEKKHYFIKDLISGQLDADRMDYLLRDSYYCGVQYGKYDLHRLLDTICICYPNNDSENEWQLGVESDGVHAVEEFIFARYWMFIQVYFHKTRRIYDYYLTKFVRFALERERLNSYPTNLDEYLSWADSKILQFIDHYGKNNANNWAINLYKRQHIKEAFVSIPHPEHSEDEKKDELGKIAWVIEQTENNFPVFKEPDRYHIDQSKTSSSKYLIEIPKFLTESQDDEEIKLYAIPVIDKLTGKMKSIQDFSLPVRNLSDKKKINILRIYADKHVYISVRDFCREMYENGYNVYLDEIEQKRAIAEKKRQEYEEAQKEVQMVESQHKQRKKRVE